MSLVMLNGYHFVFLDCFPLFLHFLSSLIKLLVWLKFCHRQKADRGQGGKRPQGLSRLKWGWGWRELNSPLELLI